LLHPVDLETCCGRRVQLVQQLFKTARQMTRLSQCQRRQDVLDQLLVWNTIWLRRHLDSTFVCMYTLSKKLDTSKHSHPLVIGEFSLFPFSYVALYEFFVKNLWKFFCPTNVLLCIQLKQTELNILTNFAPKYDKLQWCLSAKLDIALNHTTLALYKIES